MKNILNISDSHLRQSWSDLSVLQAVSYAPDCGLDPSCLKNVQRDHDT